MGNPHAAVDVDEKTNRPARYLPNPSRMQCLRQGLRLTQAGYAAPIINVASHQTQTESQSRRTRLSWRADGTTTRNPTVTTTIRLIITRTFAYSVTRDSLPTSVPPSSE